LGIPPAAIRAELSKRRLPPDLIDLQPTHQLPADLQTQPVMVEFTEVCAPQPNTPPPLLLSAHSLLPLVLPSFIADTLTSLPSWRIQLPASFSMATLS
jgi:hypothetical protein